MNFDPNSPREELEARITALLLGELTPEEAALVEQAIAQDAELARLRDQLQLAIGLVRNTAALPPNAEKLQLPSRKRQRLLKSFKIVRAKGLFSFQRKIDVRTWGALAAMLIGLLGTAFFVFNVLVGPSKRREMIALGYPLSDASPTPDQHGSETRTLNLFMPPVEDRPNVRELSKDRADSYWKSPSSPPAVETKTAAKGERNVLLEEERVNELASRRESSLAALPRIESDLSAMPPPGQPQGSGHVYYDSLHIQTGLAANGPQSSPSRGEVAVTLGGDFGGRGGVEGMAEDLLLKRGGANLRKHPAEPAGEEPAVKASPAIAGVAGGLAVNEQMSQSLAVSALVLPAAPPVAEPPAVSYSFGVDSATSLGTDVSKQAGLTRAGSSQDKPAMQEDFGAFAAKPREHRFFLNAQSNTPPGRFAADGFARQNVSGGPPANAPIDQLSKLEARTAGDKSEKAADELREGIIVGKPFTTAPAAAGAALAPARELAEGEKRKLEQIADLKKQEQSIAEVQQKLEKENKPNRELLALPAPPRTPSPTAPVPQPEVQTAENAFSTFSLNVSDVSFKLAAASLEKGVMPDPATVRSEEFINAFDYRDPEPQGGAPLAFAWERARYSFAHNRDLLRFSIKTAAIGRQAVKPLNLVLMLDNSGSMERADRVRIIQECLRVLASQLQPHDRVSVVGFSRTARLYVDGLPGHQAGELVQRAGTLTPQGGTNLEDAMTLAYETARRHYQAEGINRVVLLTDGAANLGDVEPQSLQKKVESQRKQGIALDCFGIGWEGLNDDLLETLSRHGDGRYGFVNTPEAAATEFAGQLAGALQVAASDVKVQVEFNPKRVTSYRQIGYAKHQLQKEQFRDNTVDAAEIGAAEAGNALYVAQVNPNGEGPLAIVRARFKVPGTTDYREHEWAVPYTGSAAPLEQSSPAIRLAAAASAFSEWLVASPYAAEITTDRLLAVLGDAPKTWGADQRPQKLEWMIRQARSLAGNK